MQITGCYADYKTIMKKEDLRIVYMGTPDFAVEALRQLVEGGYNVVGVITMPDKPAGRGHKIQYSPVKQYALEQNLPLLQPEKLKDEAFVEALREWKADLQIVVAFRMLPEVVWNMPRLGTKEGLNAPFILPPKAEQEKIAELLDSHLMQVENIKAQLNAIIPILKKFRQSVLADAVSGRLTNNLNLQTKKLKDITLSVSDGDHQSPPKSSNGVPFLVISDVSNGELNLEKASRFVPSDYFENLKDIRVPKSGDLLYTVTGSFGIPVIVHNDDKFCFQRHIAIIRPKKEQIDTSYLYYFLKSNLAFKQAVKTATGTAQKTVALSSLRNFDIILPTLKEQREIVERVEQLFAFADNINTQINNALQRVNHLTQSILHQAFTGQLTADWRAKHPELITGDNSAEKLLEQIQAAKQAQTPAKKDKAKMPKTTKAKPEQGQLL